MGFPSGTKSQQTGQGRVALGFDSDSAQIESQVVVDASKTSRFCATQAICRRIKHLQNTRSAAPRQV